VKWLRKAAESRHLEAMEHLARRYREGDGITKNTEQARRWAERVRQHAAQVN
jgi:TPR repeat protein